MKLYFEFSPKELAQSEFSVIDAITAAVSGATVTIDHSAARICVDLPAGADPVAAAESVRLAALPFGVALRQVGYHAPFTPPPITCFGSAPKKRRGVSVSVFVLSLIAVALIFSILSAALTGVYLLGSASTLGTQGQESEDYVGKIALVDAIFNQFSIYDTDGNLLLDEMLLAYARATGDRYAYYYNAEEFAALLAQSNAEGVGIGVSVVADTQAKGMQIVRVYADSPAAAAGLLPGDVIVAFADGEQWLTVAELGYEIAVERFAGPEGAAVSFRVLRDDQSLDFTVTRAKMIVQSVDGRVSETDATVGIVRISGFDLKTPEQFKAEMSRLIAAGCERFVFDVRGNPGGDLRSIKAVLSCFLNKGDAIVSMNRKDGTSSLYRAEPVTYSGDDAPCSIKEEEIGIYSAYKGKMVVLVNENTASAAELFTAVLQEYELADVVGLTTYGKGIYQNLIDLSPYGYTGCLRLTVGYYSPPSGNHYDGVGIIPDLSIAQSADKRFYLLEESEDAQLQAAIQATKNNIEI